MESPLRPGPRRVDLLGVALALGCAAVMFGPALRAGHTLSGGDLALWVPQFVQAHREGLFFPRWFPYYYAGLAQQFQFLSQAGFTMVLVPPFSFHAVAFALDVVIAGLGSWCLFRSWRLRLGACAVGAVAYPLSNHLVTWVQAGHLWKYDTTCWTPWLVLALDRAQDTGRLRWFAWAGAFLGLHLLGGDVQLAYYVGLVIAFRTLARGLAAWRASRAGRSAPWPPGAVRRQLVGHLLCLALAAGFGAEVVAHYAHLLRTQDIVAGESRAERWKFATEFSLPPEETLGLAAGGGLFGHTLDGPHYWGRSIARGTDDYLGIGALCFALCAVYVRRDRRSLGWAACALGALLLAYGKYVPALYRLADALPFMAALRNPNRWLFVTAWATVVLAALGTDAWLGAGEDDRWHRRVTQVGGALAGIAVVGVGLALWQRADPTWWRNTLYHLLARHGADVTEVNVRLGRLHAEVLRATLLLGAWAALTGGWSLLRRPGSRWVPTVAAACATLLVAGDLAAHAHPFVRTFDARAAFARTPLIDAVSSPPLGGRVKLWQESPALRRTVTRQFPYFGVASLDVISSRRPPEYTAVLDAWRRGALSTEHLFRLFHVTTLVSAAPLPPTAPAHSRVGVFDGVHVAAVAAAAPRAEVIGDFNVLPPAAILRRMSEPDFNPAAQLLLETGPPVRPETYEGPVRGTAHLERETPHRLVFRVSASRPAMLLVHDLYDPHWRAAVEGTTAPILRANGLLRAIPIPRGTDMRVELTYAPPRWPWALTLAGWGAIAVALAAVGVQWYRQEPPAARAAEAA